MPEPGPEPS